jgi:uncharacterized protein (DUF305 family)
LKFKIIVASAALAALPTLTLAQGMHGGHAGHGATSGTAAAQADTPATKAYREANDRMHKDMDIQYSGNADVDFVRGMIPHHQGAIDMAKVVLQHGKDEQTRKWATDVIREQEREIAEMTEWLKKKSVE